MGAHHQLRTCCSSQLEQSDAATPSLSLMDVLSHVIALTTRCSADTALPETPVTGPAQQPEECPLTYGPQGRRPVLNNCPKRTTAFVITCTGVAKINTPLMPDLDE